MLKRRVSRLRQEKRELKKELKNLRELEFQAEIDDLADDWENYIQIPVYNSHIKKISGLDFMLTESDFSGQENLDYYTEYVKNCDKLQKAINKLNEFYRSDAHKRVLNDIIIKAESGDHHSDSIKRCLISNISNKRNIGI